MPKIPQIYSSSLINQIMHTKMYTDTSILESWITLCTHDHLSTKYSTLPSIRTHSSFNLTLLLIPLACIQEINLYIFIKVVRLSDAKTVKLDH